MLNRIRKHLPYIEVVDFEDLKRFNDYKVIPKFEYTRHDLFSLLMVLERDVHDYSGKYDVTVLGIVTSSNLIRKILYEDLEKKRNEYKRMLFLTLKNGKTMLHRIGKDAKKSKNDHYEIEFHEWNISEVKCPCIYWIKPSNAKRVADALSIMLNDKPDATLWLDELHKQVSDMTRLKLGLILRKMEIATRRVYDTTTKRLRRKIVTPRRMLKTAIEQYHIS